MEARRTPLLYSFTSLAEEDKTTKKDEEKGGECTGRFGFIQASTKLHQAGDSRMSNITARSSKMRREKMALGYEITGEVIWHPGGLRSPKQALSCLLAVFEARSLRKQSALESSLAHNSPWPHLSAQEEVTFDYSLVFSSPQPDAWVCLSSSQRLFQRVTQEYSS